MIHATAIIDPAAKIADNVEIGPYSVIGADVSIGSGTTIGAHVVIEGPTTIGEDNTIYQFASLGAAPQDKKYAGEPTTLVIGDRNTIREFCTFNRGTTQDEHTTIIGDDNWIMAYVHIAHDCIVGNGTILANNVTLAGHVHVGDMAILGGFTKAHQFCRIGAHAFCGFDSGLSQDVPPYVTVGGQPIRAAGINSEGLKRRGYSPETIRAIKDAYKKVYRAGLTVEQAVEALRVIAEETPEVTMMADFIASSERGLVR